MYGIQPDGGSGPGHGHDHAPGSMLPPTSTSSPYRHDQQNQHQHQQHHHHQQQQQQQHQNNQYPYQFESYPPPPPGGPSTSVPAYDYSYGRAPQGDMQPPLSVNIDPMSSAFGHDPAANWGSPYHGAGTMSHDRNTERGEPHMQAPWNGDNQMYGDFTGQGDMHRSTSGNGHVDGDNGADWRRSAPGWGNDYGRPAGNDVGVERELETLRLNLNDLVESIRPYAASAANPQPPRAPPYVQSRFVRLASTIQNTLSTLQPHIHVYLHPEFHLLPPSLSRSTSTPGASSSIKPLTAAEKEMEVIRKRRDMLIARAAQVQASSHPSVTQQHQYHHQSPYNLQHSLSSGSSPLSSHVFDTHLPTSWKHGEIYQNNGGMYNPGASPMSTNNSGSPFTAVPFDSNPMNANRKSAMSMDSFDASLARFSLDPTKIGTDGLAKKAAPEGGRCHGCGVNVTAEWRRGPDGPRSLCNACGLHYAKLTRKRALEEANANGQQAVTSA